MSSLPPGMGDMYSVRTLNLPTTAVLAGTLPSQLSRLALLTSLQFSGGGGLGLSGTLPSQWGMLTNLESVYVADAPNITGACVCSARAPHVGATALHTSAVSCALRAVVLGMACRQAAGPVGLVEGLEGAHAVRPVRPGHAAWLLGRLEQPRVP